MRHFRKVIMFMIESLLWFQSKVEKLLGVDNKSRLRRIKKKVDEETGYIMVPKSFRAWKMYADDRPNGIDNTEAIAQFFEEGIGKELIERTNEEVNNSCNLKPSDFVMGRDAFLKDLKDELRKNYKE